MQCAADPARPAHARLASCFRFFVRPFPPPPPPPPDLAPPPVRNAAEEADAFDMGVPPPLPSAPSPLLPLPAASIISSIPAAGVLFASKHAASARVYCTHAFSAALTSSLLAPYHSLHNTISPRTSFPSKYTHTHTRAHTRKPPPLTSLSPSLTHTHTHIYIYIYTHSLIHSLTLSLEKPHHHHHHSLEALISSISRVPFSFQIIQNQTRSSLSLAGF